MNELIIVSILLIGVTTYTLILCKLVTILTNNKKEERKNKK